MTEETATPFGRYRLIREIGRGGEAIVHLALDAMLHRRVALKVFPRVVVADASPPGFRAEVEALARVRHPGVCEVHDAGIEDGSPYIAMSYVEGQSLAEVGRVSAREASRLGADVADVIAAAHAQGVIHGDVKPENVVLTTQGRCVVLDFGVARLLDEAGTPGTARIGGTLPYVAPERLD